MLRVDCRRVCAAHATNCGMRNSQHFADVLMATCSSGEMVRSVCGLEPHNSPLTEDDEARVRDILSLASLADPSARPERLSSLMPSISANDSDVSAPCATPAVSGTWPSVWWEAPRLSSDRQEDGLAHASCTEVCQWPHAALCLAGLDAFSASSPLRGVSEDALVGAWACCCLCPAVRASCGVLVMMWVWIDACVGGWPC